MANLFLLLLIKYFGSNNVFLFLKRKLASILKIFIEFSSCSKKEKKKTNDEKKALKRF